MTSSKQDNPCPACGTPIGQQHKKDCDVEPCTETDDAGVNLVEAHLRDAISTGIDEAIEAVTVTRVADKEALLEEVTPAIRLMATEFVRQRRKGKDVALDSIMKSLLKEERYLAWKSECLGQQQ
jgi:hypothetical protein